MGGSTFVLCLLLFSGLRGPQGHAKMGPSWRGCDRTGAAGASPIGPGPTERDPGPGRDSTWDQLNALGPTEPGPLNTKLKPPAGVVTAGSYQDEQSDLNTKALPTRQFRYLRVIV